MGVLVAIGIVLLLIGLLRKEIKGLAKSWILVSYGFAAVILIRWILVIAFRY